MNKEQINISQEYQYLQFVDFRDLGFWDAKSYAKNSLVSGKYELVKITKLLKKQRSKIEIQNDQIYKQLTVRLYGNGVILRKEEFGKNIKTKNQYIAKSGQLVFSRIDARSGAFGIVPDSLDGAIVTNDFPVYSINNDVALSDYLRLIISSPSFTEICKSKSSGTTGRLRMSEIDFENIKVPQPPLPKQQELVAAYNQKTIEAATKEQKANQLEKSIDEYLIEELGIELPQEEAKQNHFLKLVEFKDLSEWDVWNKPNKERSYKYKTIRIDESLEKIKSKVLKLQTKEFKAVGEIPIISQEKDFISGYTSKNIEVVGKEDLPLIVYGDHSQIKKLIDFEFVVGADGVKLLKPIKDFDPLYFLYFLETIKFNTSQKYTRHFKFLKKELIPLPPLPIQNQIADKISSIKQEIKTLRNEAEKLKTQAKEEFENEVFEVQNSL